MQRVVIQSPGEVVLEDVPEPSAGPGEVVVEVAYCGICGSDLHAYQGKHPFVPLPATPGHEFSGRVYEMGEGVTGFTVGQRVTVEPSLVCGECYLCKIGRYNICEKLRVMGCQGDGAMQKYFVVPAAKVVPIPDELSMKDAALVEPLAVGVHACRRAGSLQGLNVAIVGAGTIGLTLLGVVKICGVKRIAVIDLSNPRLEIAKKMGATITVNPSEVDVEEALKSPAPYEGWDVAFECVGIEATIRTCLDLVRKGGKVVVVGVFGEETTVKMANIQDRETEVIGTLMYLRRDFVDAVDYLATKQVVSDDIITGVFPLEEAADAFSTAMDTKTNLKVMLKIGDDW
jgi:L-iditol 2-dehydrogenase